MNYIDAIIYVEKFSELVAYLDSNAPETLERDEEGALAMPPNVVAFSRTPAQVNGDKLLAYCRFTAEQAEQWRGTPGVVILGEAPYVPGVKGTVDEVYRQVFDDAEMLAKYESVWSRTKTYVDEDGNEVEIRQDRFGLMGGA